MSVNKIYWAKLAIGTTSATRVQEYNSPIDWIPIIIGSYKGKSKRKKSIYDRKAWS